MESESTSRRRRYESRKTRHLKHAECSRELLHGLRSKFNSWAQ